MIRYLTLAEVLEIYVRVMAISGGATGIQDMDALASAIMQPQMTFGGQDLYSTLSEKAAALGHGLILNHSFIDGNKRIGHAAMEVFLMLNGYEIEAPGEEQEKVILSVAAGKMNRSALAAWLDQHIKPISEERED